MATVKDKETDAKKTTGKLQLAKERHYTHDFDTDNPWDYQKTAGNQQSHAAAHKKGSFASKNTRMVMLVSRCLMYLAAMGMIGVFIYLSLSEHVDIFANIMKYRSVFSILTILFIVDAIIINICYEKNVILILFAWILNFFYPWKRDKSVHDGNVGKVLTVGIIAAIIGMTGTFFAAYTTYGAGTLAMEDDTSRHIVAECLEQEETEGAVLGKALFKNFDIRDVKLEQTNKETTITFTGMGNVDANDLQKVADKSMPTVLTYKKTSAKGDYKLTAVMVDDTELRANRLKDFEKLILQK